MKRTFPLLIALLTMLLVGCGTFYKVAVTVSEAEDAVMKEWATLHNDGKTSEALDQKVLEAHNKFNEAKLVAANALRAYKAGGDKAQYITALEAARSAIDPLLNLLSPLLTSAKNESLKMKALNASGI